MRTLAGQLHSIFTANHWAHAEQLADGNYKTVYAPLGISRIQSLLEEGDSCLTYQLSSGGLRWICFDVDIKSETLKREDYADVEKEAQQEVIDVVTLLVDFLNEKKLSYLLEYSGNRGAHVWVLWKEVVNQRSGYALLQYILEGSQALIACKLTTIDKFPQSVQSRGKFGQGVKLPLSKHKKSGFYSYFVTEAQELRKCFSAANSSFTLEMIAEQSHILDSFILPAWPAVVSCIELDEQEIQATVIEPAYSRLTMKLSPGQVPTLKSILSDLAECGTLRPLIEQYNDGGELSEKERTILVGLLRRLQFSENLDFGKDLLFELFSNLPNFNADITTAKLSNLNLYPPTCSYLSESIGLSQGLCDAHKECQIRKSPIELIENCKIDEEDIFGMTARQFEAIRHACLRYSEVNDEVDLYFLREEMLRIDTNAALDLLPKSLSMQSVVGSYYEFERPESPEKVRTLVSLGAYDALLSTWFTKILDGLFGTEISPNSYGYQFEPSLFNGNLFKPWFPQWIKYTTDLSRFIEGGTFDDCWVVKFDIRSFYDQISLTRLRVKLGVGPSRACGFTLQSLDQESRENYDKICSILVEWCRVISECDRGVPQGPAFARYLAELYLMQFDQDIADMMFTHQAQYFRWVDDIFIIAPDQASAQAVNLAARGEIEALSLEVNEEKAYLGSVRDYRMRFQEYKSDSKYFVNQVSRNYRTTSTSLNAQAREELNKLIDGPNGVGFRSENAAFFLTHLKTSPQVVSQFIPDLLNIEHGRGSLFAHLFDYIVKDMEECEYRPDRWNISGLIGLKLESFLNALLTSVNGSQLTLKASENITNILMDIENGANSRISNLLINHIKLSDSKLSEKIKFDDTASIDELILCLNQCKRTNIIDAVVDKVLGQLSLRPIEEAIETLHSLILDNHLTKVGYKRSADKFFALVLEQIEQGGGASQTLDCLVQSKNGSGELLKKYHMLCCFCFVTSSAKNTVELGQMWIALIVLTNDLDEWRSERAYWLEKADCVDINPGNISALFAAGIGGDGLCPGKADIHKVYEDYHYHLLVFLFALSNDDFVKSLPSKEELLLEANKQGMLYLVWLLDAAEGVELYPSKKVCLQNIVENDLTILKRSNEILVRFPKEPGFNSPPLLPKLILSKDESQAYPFTNNIYEFPIGSVPLQGLIQAEPDLAGVIRCVTQVYRSLRQIRDNQQGKTRGVANVFLDGFGLLEGSLTPVIPVTSLGSKLLVSDGSVVRAETNSLDSAWGILLKLIESSRRDLLPYDHHSQVLAENVRSLIPSQIVSSDNQVEFLGILGKNLKVSADASVFDIDRAKMQSAAEFATILHSQDSPPKGRRVPTLFGTTADIYLSITGERNEFARRMSFSVIDTFSDNSLGELLDSITTSLSWAKQHSYLGIHKIDIVKAIETDFFELAKLVCYSDALANAGERLVLDDAKKISVSDGEDYELVVDGVEFISSTGDIVVSEVSVIRFGAYKSFEEPLKPQHAADLRRSLVYSIKDDCKTVVILVDDIIRNVFETIRKRSDAFNKLGHSVDPAQMECLKDPAETSRLLRSSSHFRKACDVVRSNNYTSGMIKGMADCERVLLRWLEQFSDSEASVLLEVIASHQCITEEDVNSFISNVKLHNTGSILFSTKDIADQGGMYRLFTLTQEGQELNRSLDLSRAVSAIANNESSGKKLVILTENILTGGQLKGNFERHYLSTGKADSTYIDKQKLFEIDNKPKFIQGLKQFSEIVILSAAYTQRGADSLKKYLSSQLDICPSCVKFEGTPLDDSLCFFGKSEDISADTKREVQKLVSDMERVKTIFDVDDEVSYKNRLKKFEYTNLIVRPNSVTKKGMQIFVLPSKNKNIAPLFRLTKEHGKKP